jgi:hypothetical protein
MVLTYNNMQARVLLLAVLIGVAASGCGAHRAARSGAATTATPSGPSTVATAATAPATNAGNESGEFAALMQSWNGHTINDLFRTWGRPVYLYSDGEGALIAVYIPEAFAGPSPRPSIPRDRGELNALSVYDPRLADAWPIYRTFFADRAGRIVRSEWRGEWECCSR